MKGFPIAYVQLRGALRVALSHHSPSHLASERVEAYRKVGPGGKEIPAPNYGAGFNPFGLRNRSLEGRK